MTIRYDVYPIQATKTPEGFIQDSPVIGRVGILEYRNPDGSTRREFRPPEEAFSADSLNTLRGKPVTAGHPGLVTAKTMQKSKTIGTILTEGKQDGDNIRADLIIYNLDTNGRELSCGYKVDLDETPGEYNGVKYDAIQRNIRYNHVAVVPRGRAGSVARLNMDGDGIYENEEELKLMKIKLDSGIEYEAAPEVIAELNKIKADNAEIKTKLDTTEAKADTLQAEKVKLDEKLKTIEKEHADGLNEAVKQRVSLLSVAEKHKIEKADEMTDRKIKEAVITAVRGDGMELDKKSDEYVQAAFDLVKEDTVSRENVAAENRKKLGGKPREDEKNQLSSSERRAKMIEDLKNDSKEAKE